jgi:hypothetical protein
MVAALAIRAPGALDRAHVLEVDQGLAEREPRRIADRGGGAGSGRLSATRSAGWSRRRARPWSSNRTGVPSSARRWRRGRDRRTMIWSEPPRPPKGRARPGVHPAIHGTLAFLSIREVKFGR